jgi:hypothetical protein
MSHSRLPSDSSAGTHGPGAKEARAVGRSPASSTAPVDPDAPLVLQEEVGRPYRRGLVPDEHE